MRETPGAREEGEGELLPALQAAARVEFTDFGGGRRMCWRGFGHGGGPPLVLLHGGHGSWLHWARNVQALAARYTVWAPDLPGYGDSDEPPAASLDALVDATLQSLDTLVPRETPLRLVGFSFGSLVAAHIAVRRGAVSHLGLLGPAGHGGPRRPRGELHAWRGLEAHSPPWNETMRHNLLMHMLHEPNALDALDAQALQIHGQSCLRTRFHSKTISRAGAITPLLDAHRGALLLAWGEHDVTLEPAFVAQSLGAGHAARVVRTIPGAGHWVQYEAAQQVNDLLLAWLGGEPAQA